jgi:outer membrane biosynthesis protein TonB
LSAMSHLPSLDELAAFFGDDIDMEMVKATIAPSDKPVPPKPETSLSVPKLPPPQLSKPTKSVSKPKPPEVFATPKKAAPPELKPRAVAPQPVPPVAKRTASVPSPSRAKPKPPTPPVSSRPPETTAKSGWIVMTLQPL